MKRKQNKSFIVFFLAVLLVIIIFMAGWLFGVSQSKNIEKKTSTEISQIENTISAIEGDVQILQIKESFINSLGSDVCNKDILDSIGLNDELSFYWSVLPKRLEEYEKSNPLSEEYLAVKNKYMISSFRAWIISRTIYNKCDDAPIPILYLYSRNCESCVEQGKILDELYKFAKTKNIGIRIFTIDSDFDNETIGFVKNYYELNSTPAIVIVDTVLKNNLISLDDLEKTILKESKSILFE